MDYLEGDELVVSRRAARDEEERRVTPVDDLRVCKNPDQPCRCCSLLPWSLTFVFEEIAHACPSGQNQLRDIFDDLCFVLRRECCEPFGQSLLWEFCFSLF